MDLNDISLIHSNKFLVILRRFCVNSAEIRYFGLGEWSKFAVNSLLIPENGYSGIGFWVNKYRPTIRIPSRGITRLFCFAGTGIIS